MEKIFLKNKILLLIIILFVLFCVVIFNIKNKNIIYIEEDNFIDIKEEVLEIEEEIHNHFFVDIKGAVLNPDVYKMNYNSRIIDVIDTAGGLTENADTSFINLSKKITDEMTIIIYTEKEVENAREKLKESKEPTIIEIIKEIESECICPDYINDACICESDIDDYSDNDTIDGKINLNTASKELLITLPGIGEVKADDIIKYREETAFNSIEELKNIKGIGDSTFEKIKHLITV